MLFVHTQLLLPTRIMVLALAATAATMHAQQTPTQMAASIVGDDDAAKLARQLTVLADESEAAATNDSGPEGIVPLTKGFNASLGTTSEHDSAGGWSSTLTPNIAYRFDKHFSINLGLPVYTYVMVDTTIPVKVPKNAPAANTTILEPEHWDLGDTDLVGAFDLHTHWFDYNLSATLGIPTGDDADALGAGQFTYSFVNHFERPIGSYVTPSIELGIDNSPNLDDARIHKSYEDVGTNAHFQAGLGLSLPWNMNFETDAYEELPLTDQTITTTVVPPPAKPGGKKGKAYTVSQQVSIGEDNGFQNTLDIPITGHFTLSGFYTRSLREKTDIAGFSLTFLLRAPPRAKKNIVH